MLKLVNNTGTETLLSSIENATKRTTKANDGRTFSFYAVTCYFNPKAIEALAECISKALKENKAQLAKIHVFVDIADWIKSRASKPNLVNDISQKTGLEKREIDFIPIHFPNRLFHAKSYAVISERHKKAGERKGFVAVTSGNLTKQGMGLVAQENNMEFVSIVDDTQSLEDFIGIVHNLERNHKASEELIIKQENFLFALSLFSLGDFYHEWEGNLSEKIRFKLNLTEEGIEASKTQEQLFRDYRPDSKSISSNPVDLQQIFSRFPKPFQGQFWPNYSINTLLGKWVPEEVAKQIDLVLERNVEPYIEEIREATNDERLERLSSELVNKVDDFKRKNYVKEDPEKVVLEWQERVIVFRDDREFIKARILHYEKVSGIIDVANRALIIQTFERMQSQLEMNSRPKGVKRVIRDAIESREIEKAIEEFRQLGIQAKKRLGL